MNQKIERYQKYRTEGQQLNSKLLDTLNNDELIDAGRTLGMIDDSNDEEILYHEGELDMAIQSDFAIHEIEDDGATACERFYQAERWNKQIEREILEALQDSYTSLFEVVDADPDNSVLVLSDVLGIGEPRIELIDMNLSQTANSGALIFFRSVPLPEMTITSGFALPFEAVYKKHLISVYQQVIDKAGSRPDSVKRFYTFYRLYKKYGSISFVK